MRIIDLAVAVIFFIASAGVTALLMAVCIHYGLGVPPAALRMNALISASALGVVLLVAMAGAHESED
ncbi:hypothetical protein [Bradyrhizobium australiense]|uniref:Uncharacterized protein n=1 Tax=Bradyrhizobium australiense TaxID=2721161 RepID=A0A7Y4GV76_9BRAD|nr:hypothetical protein [Bradyrhizobium australiense]NOJ42218.1 hypothetical protein [Bradyrhizobium australiense]